MATLPACPACQSVYTYEDRGLYVCPECGHEWSGAETGGEGGGKIVRDANGVGLKDGDTVTVIKDLETQMKQAARDLELEKAAALRDEVVALPAVAEVAPPVPVDLERAGGLTAIGVAHVGVNAAILPLEFLDGVKGHAALQAVDRRV